MSGPAGRLDPVLLDVADTDSVARAGEYVARRCADNGLWGLVNNAAQLIRSDASQTRLDRLAAWSVVTIASRSAINSSRRRRSLPSPITVTLITRRKSRNE